MEKQQWLQDRCGLITSSNIYKIIGKGRAKDKLFTDSGESYLNQVVHESITGQVADEVTSKAMEWGIQHEVLAIEALRSSKYPDIEHYGVDNPRIYKSFSNEYHGGSPDFVCTVNGIKTVGEIKCPYTGSNVIELLGYNIEDDIKSNYPEYYWQVLSNMMLTGASEGLLCIFDPRMTINKIKHISVYGRNEDMELLTERLELAKKFINEKIKGIFESFKITEK